MRIGYCNGMPPSVTASVSGTGAVVTMSLPWSGVTAETFRMASPATMMTTPGFTFFS
jgi:hypothetical protein